MIKNNKKPYRMLIALISIIILPIFTLSGCSNAAELDAVNGELTNSQQMLADKQDEISSQADEIKNKTDEIEELLKQLDELNLKITTLEQDNQIMSNQLNTPAQFSNIEELVPKVAYLTFDDGPSAVTNQVLDVLERYNIKATFFVVYTDYGMKNDMYNKIVDAGHALGNHTYNHISPNKGWDVFYEDMMKMEDFLYEQTGLRPRIIRFPGGTSNSWGEKTEYIENVHHLHEMGYEYFDWNVSTSDGGKDHLTTDNYLEFVRSRSYNGSVEIINVLMHDRGNRSSTAKALPTIIEYLRASGYTFLPLTVESSPIQIFDVEVDCIASPE